MVNYTIISGIPDSIFTFMLHLKLPLEKWDYLKKHFGLIPRPESWLAAEEAMWQSRSQPEQGTAGETAQNIFNSHHKPEIQTSGEEDFTDSPNDCAETKSGYPTPESEVIDMQGAEDNLPEVEVEVVDASNSHDKHMNLVKAPNEDSQHASNKIKESQALPGLSLKALEPEGDLPDTTSECTETQTGHRKPKDKVVDMQHVVDVLPMFEVRSTGQAWYSKHVKELQASDEGSQCASDEVEENQDLLKSSSEVLKPAGNCTRQASGRSMQDGPQIPSKENQHTGMNGKTITDIPDPPGIHVKTPAPHAKHSMLQNRLPAQMHGGMVTELRLPCRGDSTDIRLTVMKLEIRATSAQMVDMPADLPHLERHPKEPDKAKDTSGGGDNKPSSKFSDSHGVRKLMLAGSGNMFQRQEMPHRWTQKCTGPSDSQTAVSQQWHKTTRQDSKHAWLKQHGTPELLWDLPWEWTGWNNWENGDATSSRTVCLHRAETQLLADSKCQHTQQEVSQQDGLPASPKPWYPINVEESKQELEVSAMCI
ncbi:hypothetical protein EDC04DRAFT_2615185 [Pisolithus marmoratus]|nr:hypothetical protein EDC04DRAFT_2615185 [Pisolithus marmoratus]